MKYVSWNIPLILTGIRLVLSPVLPILLVILLPGGMPWNFILTILFGLLGLTDFLDGYLARRYRQETIIGKLLDPVADKFLVFSTAIALIHLQKLFFYWPILVIARDVFVMGLREISLTHGFCVSVAWQGKLKTVLQLLYLALVILNSSFEFVMFPALFYLQKGLFGASLGMTLYSAIIYYQDFYSQYKKLLLRNS